MSARPESSFGLIGLGCGGEKGNVGDRLSVFVIAVVALDPLDECCGEMCSAAVLWDRLSMDRLVRDVEEKIFLVLAACLGTDGSCVLTLTGTGS